MTLAAATTDLGSRSRVAPAPRCLAATLLALVVCMPRSVSASSFAFAPSFSNKKFVLVGADLGLAVDDVGATWLAGGEVSAGTLDETRGGVPFWYGSYFDVLVDGRHDHARVSLGAEVGYSVLGLDVGPVLEIGAWRDLAVWRSGDSGDRRRARTLGRARRAVEVAVRTLT